MINIFNLFLTLFFFWLALIYSNNNISWFYVFFGIFAASSVSIIAWKMKIINKYNNFLFLSFGFYKHFFKVIFSAFFGSMLIMLKVAILGNKKNEGTNQIFTLEVKKLNNSQLVLLSSTINLMTGTLFLQKQEDKIIFYAFKNKYGKQIDLEKIYDDIEKINDNRLV